MCKEGEGRGEEGKFIRMVNAAPYPMMLIAMDYTLDDLVRFCTNPRNFSILGVDPTFNLGDFDVTVTTYRHLLLEPYGTPCGKPPTMIGPMFIHVQKDFGVYHFFTSVSTVWFNPSRHLVPFVSSPCAIQSPSLQRPPVETPSGLHSF